MKTISELFRIGVGVLAPVTLHFDGGGRGANRQRCQSGQTNYLPRSHPGYGSRAMPSTMSLEDAAATTRTGDIWLFRGHSIADTAIRAATNSPVNHVGMAVTLDDLPPLLWHAELGSSLVNVWSGEHQRGTQLHKLVDAVRVWANRYRQRAWLRKIDIEATPAMEDAVLRTVNEYSGTRFPETMALAKGWALGRFGRSASAEALFERAARLHHVSVSRPPRVIGRRTEQSLQSGLFHGYAALVEGLVLRIRGELGAEAPVVATGGLAPVFEPELKFLQAVDLGLTLEGLRLIWRKNRP